MTRPRRLCTTVAQAPAASPPPAPSQERQEHFLLEFDFQGTSATPAGEPLPGARTGIKEAIIRWLNEHL